MGRREHGRETRPGYWLRRRAGNDVDHDAQIEIAAKYSGYIDRQRDEIERHRAQEDLRLPLDLDYRTVRGFSTEVQQKLNLHKPETIGQAARISGITPAAISLLLVHLKRGFAAPADPPASTERQSA